MHGVQARVQDREPDDFLYGPPVLATPVDFRCVRLSLDITPGSIQQRAPTVDILYIKRPQPFETNHDLQKSIHPPQGDEMHGAPAHAPPDQLARVPPAPKQCGEAIVAFSVLPD
eukprot:CAMPEP_0170190078 /NCGR_PEP_ID=MMETSP0040_2-20121228/48533_1 /TAXON_ID=641309 /ORGANISM="Lotharella oceanica, Strain CCMP622" /LENGTH=113 /DNA_ID=CAMNT_0010437851 /DNA_START=667 /DNA_END=1005 /DNA_ORIENTATION=+